MFQMAPLVHAGLLTCDGFDANPIVVVLYLTAWKIKPIFLLAQGISAGLIGEDKAAYARIENGECSEVSVGKWSVEGYVVFGHLQEKLNRDCCG